MMEESHITSVPIGMRVGSSPLEVCLWYQTGDCVKSSLYTNLNKDCDGYRKCFAYVSVISGESKK